MEQPSKSWASLILALAIFLLGAVAQAAPFDERIKGPDSETPQKLKARLKAHFDTVERKQAEEEDRPGAFIRDRAAHKQWVDLCYSIERAMDEGRPLTDFAEFGLIAQPDGQYKVDLKLYPQWRPLDSSLHILTNASVLESYVPALKARGFRGADIDTLRTYVATHDQNQTTYAQGRDLIHTFARRLQKRAAAGLPVDLNEMLAYRYQRISIREEVSRQWAVGLLDAFDNQRQRILVSFFAEELISDMTFGVPSKPFNQELEEEAQPLISGEYVEQLARFEADIQREADERAEKLIGAQRK